MRIENLINKIKSLGDCVVYPPAGIPNVSTSHILPDDVYKFYELCGGALLFEKADYSILIVPPLDFQLANPIIVGELCEEDISSDWYICATDRNGEYITIDLNPGRLGRCYDSFYDRHGVVGECSIIATSFTDLLERLIENRGRHWYWLQEDFIPLGDAYDDF
ncbi:SMI1/KNR4 family protein [Aeribacillus sp. FSL K6-1121]|uniref:SMI1/KNR4 family protein n=1 Tax=Aeribacillus sp. FSL K6-1121 TaxID=2954745 RepID=UPI0030F55F11